MELLLFLETSVKIFWKYSRKFRENLGKSGRYAFVRGWVEPQEASNIIKNQVEKSMEPWKFMKILLNYVRIFT